MVYVYNSLFFLHLSSSKGLHEKAEAAYHYHSDWLNLPKSHIRHFCSSGQGSDPACNHIYTGVPQETYQASKASISLTSVQHLIRSNTGLPLLGPRQFLLLLTTSLPLLLFLFRLVVLPALTEVDT